MSFVEAVIDSLTSWRDERRRKRYVAQHLAAKTKAEAGTLTDDDLIYAAFMRCPCGAGIAYPKGIGAHGYWDCSDILTGRAAPKGHEGSKKHCDYYPFVFWEINSENQPSANGVTTRPEST
jgi:hypothetical protein